MSIREMEEGLIDDVQVVATCAPSVLRLTVTRDAGSVRKTGVVIVGGVVGSERGGVRAGTSA